MKRIPRIALPILYRESYSRKSFDAVKRKFSNQISITSLTAAGKSTTINLLREKLPTYEFISVGRFMRQRQEELGFPSIEDFVNHINTHPEERHDEWCDGQVCNIASRFNYIIAEGRLVHVFMPYAFHVYLDCDLYVRSDRRWRQKKKEINGIAAEDVLLSVCVRDVHDSDRYEGLYPGCIWDPSDYDLVVSTEFNQPDKVVELIIKGHEEWLKNIKVSRKIIIEGKVV